MFARTERLLLRPGWREDAAALTEAIGDFAVVGKLSHAPWPYALEHAEQFLGSDNGILPRCLIFARTQGAPRLIGGVGLNEADGGVEIGYWIARAYWGLGFATEASQAIVDFADRSLRLPSLGAGHLADNPASGNVLRKLGFEPTGETAMRPCRARSSVEPCIMYRRPAGARGRRAMVELHHDREDMLAA